MTGPSYLIRGLCIATVLAMLATMVLPLRLNLAATIEHADRRSAHPVRAQPHHVKAVLMEEKVPRPARRVFRFRFAPYERRFLTSLVFPDRDPATPRLRSALPPLRC